MPRGNKQFALIWWMKSGQKDVVPLCSVPKCKQKINSIVTLTWQDFKTKKEIKAVAKILAICGMYIFCYIANYNLLIKLLPLNN